MTPDQRPAPATSTVVYRHTDPNIPPTTSTVVYRHV